MSTSWFSEKALSKRTEFLKMVTLFSELGSENLKTISSKFHARTYKKQDIIFHQGDESHVLYLIRKGKVRIFGVSPSGNETSYRIFSRYDIFGEFSVIDGRPRSTAAQAIESCTLLEIKRKAFLQCAYEMPDLSMGLIKLLVEKLRFTTNYAESLVQYDTAGRLLNTILQYNEKYGIVSDSGKRYELDLSMNQEDLATMVGARREWVNRILKDWNKQGLIEYKRGKITIFDLHALKKERDHRIDIIPDEDKW